MSGTEEESLSPPDHLEPTTSEAEEFMYTLNGKKGIDLHGKIYRSAKDGEVEGFQAHDGCTYKTGDFVYCDGPPCDPFLVGCIVSFKSKKHDVMVNVMRYYRPEDVPEDSLSLMAAERGESQECAARPRELFSSDCTQLFPVSALRGRCTVHAVKDIAASRELDLLKENAFFSCVSYNVESTRLASNSGEIRVGATYQAKLPPEATSSVSEDADRDELLWRPGQITAEMESKYVRLTRTFRLCLLESNNMHDTEKSARTTDLLLDDAIVTLHRCNYKFGDALKEMNANDRLLTSDANFMTPEDTKKFNKGIKTLGKNFTRISRELLPLHTRDQLVAFYYLWKKTNDAIKPKAMSRSRAAVGGWRRQKNGNEKKNNRPSSRDLVDYASASEAEVETLEESRRTQYACHHCYGMVSRDWHHAGRDNQLLCTDCRIFFKKYGQLRPVDRPSTVPPCLFKRSSSETDQEEEGVRTRAGGKGRKRSPSWADERSPSTAQSVHEFDMEKKKIHRNNKRRKSQGGSGAKRRKEETTVKSEVKCEEEEERKSNSSSRASPDSAPEKNGESEMNGEGPSEIAKPEVKEEVVEEEEPTKCNIVVNATPAPGPSVATVQPVMVVMNGHGECEPSTSNGVKAPAEGGGVEGGEGEEESGRPSDECEECVENEKGIVCLRGRLSAFTRMRIRGGGENSCARSDLAWVKDAAKDAERKMLLVEEQKKNAPHPINLRTREQQQQIAAAMQQNGVNGAAAASALLAPIALHHPHNMPHFNPQDLMQASLRPLFPGMNGVNGGLPAAFGAIDPRMAIMQHQLQQQHAIEMAKQLQMQEAIRQQQEAQRNQLQRQQQVAAIQQQMQQMQQAQQQAQAVQAAQQAAAAAAAQAAAVQQQQQAQQAQQNGHGGMENMEAMHRIHMEIAHMQQQQQQQQAAAANGAAAGQQQHQVNGEQLQQLLAVRQYQEQLQQMAALAQFLPAQNAVMQSEMMRRLHQEGFRHQ